jgi:hypothetical protein
LAYLGNRPAESYASFETETFSVSATTNYTLSHAVTNENEIRLVINGVVQQPGSGKAYTASGTTLTLSSATASGDSMYAVYLGRALQTVNPPNASVGNSQTAPTIITGQTAETSIATDDTILIHDTSASALRKMTRANFVSGIGGANTPYFYARRGTNQDSVSNDTSTKVQFNTEDFDTGNEYDNSTNYRFVPANGNTYLIHAQIQFAASSNTILQEARIKLYKNGSEILEMRNDGYTTNLNKTAPSLSRVVTGNGSDYYEIYGRGYLSSSGTIKFGGGSFFTAFKLIT